MSDDKIVKVDPWAVAKSEVRQLVTLDAATTDALAKKKVDEKDFWPGKINYVDSRGHHPGATCRYLYGDSPARLAEVIDLYFHEYTGMLLLDVKPLDPFVVSGGLQCGALVFYTRIVDKEELDDFNEIQRIASTLLDTLRDEKAKQKEAREFELGRADREAKEKSEAAMKELTRLAELGKQHENNCKKKKSK